MLAAAAVKPSRHGVTVMPNLSLKVKAPWRKLPAESARVVLTVNGGSSSIKFALYPADSLTTRMFSGKIERIGLPKPMLTIRDGALKVASQVIAAPHHRAAGEFLIAWLERHVGFARVAGVGHRVVHGGLKFILGIRLDARRNKAGAPVISTRASRVTVRVIRTDEEVTIAKTVCRVLGLSTKAPVDARG